MKEISHLIRIAYLDLINPLIVEGVTIPVVDMVLNTNQAVPTYRSGRAFVICSDQTEVETSNNDCTYRQNSVITFDVVVQYPNGSGSRLATELISDAIQERVVSLDGQFIQIGLQGFQVLNTQKSFAQSLMDQGQTLTAFRKRIIFTQQVWQNAQSIPVIAPQNTFNTTLNTVL